ncbi:MAG TPA: hypothetical protein V6C95_12910 [Coleofasciculaceae cyanobacterium]
MGQTQKDFGFCTLALRPKYRLLAKQLAQDLETYSPGTVLVIGTDEPQDFEACSNVWAFQLHQRGIFHCYHDKRFVIQEALLKCRSAIMIDADTRIAQEVPSHIQWSPGITGRNQNIREHITKYTPERLEIIEKVANKLSVQLDDARWIGESLFVVSQDNGKEIEFINIWGKIGDYLELKGIHAGSGNAIGLAAAKVGWTIHEDQWQTLRNVTQHLDASYEKKAKPFVESWQRRLGYHYRLNLARLKALKEFNFYYR